MEKRPQNWEVEPDEYLGTSYDGYDYYRLEDQVFRQMRDADEQRANSDTAWCCIAADFPPIKKLWRVRYPQAGTQRTMDEMPARTIPSAALHPKVKQDESPLELERPNIDAQQGKLF